MRIISSRRMTAFDIINNMMMIMMMMTIKRRTRKMWQFGQLVADCEGSRRPRHQTSKKV